MVVEYSKQERIRIEVNQLPPVSSSPNWRGHWTTQHKEAKVYHNALFYSCVDARNRGYSQGMSFPFIKARLDLTLVFPEYRRRDRDNCVSMFKPGLDAIVDAGLLLDDDAEHLEIGNLDIVVDKERAPLTIIELEAEGG